MSFKETEVGRIPIDWEVDELSNKVDLVMGQSPKSEFYNDKGIGMPFMQGRTTFGEKYHYINTWCTDIKRVGIKNSVLMSVRAPVGDVNIATEDICIGRGLASLNMKNKNNEFLYYLLKNYSGLLISKESGTVFGSINKAGIEKLVLPFPSNSEQKAIAKILSDLDEKIEINNKINKNLEEMAQAIFKQWFVDFEFPNEEGKPYKSSGGEMVESELGMIPKGFKVKSIGELPLIITDYVANGSFKSLKENVNMYDEINYAIIVRNTDLKSNFKSDCKYVDKKSYDFLAKSKLFGGELIISNVGDVGSIYLCPKFKKQMTLGSNLIMIDTESSENIGFNLILYRFFKSYIGQYYIKSITGGSAQPKFNKTDFKKIQFINPSNSILKLYNEKNEVIESIIMNNVLENERLEKLRDTLLPKLMSGEIRVCLENSEN
ncbi:restriction endonuclease subunit S [Clostridium perfringens]|uniref:restriction endonuclease subunit S n=1 Tax=Clostridium perfringens TaxID=1502 RepID=UPI0018E41069|nr:restriction endonuclease subunit S [Clostridium perfringens]MBI6061838.1 restriction endonuclease subunit S [Clostridium perfringens]